MSGVTPHNRQRGKEGTKEGKGHEGRAVCEMEGYKDKSKEGKKVREGTKGWKEGRIRKGKVAKEGHRYIDEREKRRKDKEKKRKEIKTEGGKKTS